MLSCNQAIGRPFFVCAAVRDSQLGTASGLHYHAACELICAPSYFAGHPACAIVAALVSLLDGKAVGRLSVCL